MDAAERAIAACEELAAYDIQDRNIGPLAAHVRGNLLAASRSISAHPAASVAIITGFFLIHAEPPNCETDGPPGAALLAGGLTALGIPCRVATDTFSADIVHSAIAAAGLKGTVPVDVVSSDLEGGHGLPVAAVRDRWRSAARPVTHVVAVERCGPSADGRLRDVRGVDISDRNMALEALFDGGWTTIGIGDLGNELGMGSLPRELVASCVANGESIWCAVPSDHALVSGISNLGAAALLAAVALQKPGIGAAALPFLEPAFSQRILDAIAEAGAVAAGPKGTAPAPRPYVDGLSWPVLEDTHRRIHLICKRTIDEMAGSPDAAGECRHAAAS